MLSRKWFWLLFKRPSSAKRKSIQNNTKCTTILQFPIGRVREENYFFLLNNIAIRNILNLQLYCNKCEATQTWLRGKEFKCLYATGFWFVCWQLGGCFFFFSHGFFFSFPFSLSVSVKLAEPAPSSVFYNSVTLVCESPEQGSNTVNWKSILYPSVDHIKSDWAEMNCFKKNLYSFLLSSSQNEVVIFNYVHNISLCFFFLNWFL